MASGFTISDGTDFDDLFMPIVGSAGTDTGYVVANGDGIQGDIANRYETSTGGDQIDNPTGYLLPGGADLQTRFKKLALGPSITSQPTSQSVNEGSALTFTITATGTGTLSYQWQRDVGSGWTNVGTNSSTLTYNPSARGDQGSYRCQVTDSVGTTQSNTVTATVDYPPSVTSGATPSQAGYDPGNAVAISITASDGQPTGITYQWRKDGVNIDGSTEGGKYSGYNANQLTFLCAESDNGADYDCVVSNSAGSDTSAVATLVVTVTPAAPTNPAATAVSASQIDVSWTASSGATSYNVYRWNGSTYAPHQSGIAATSYSDTGLTASTQYWYVITAVNTAGESGFSNEATTTTHPPAPGAPSNLVATAMSSSQIDLSWNAGSNASTYNVYIWDGSTYVLLQSAVATTSYSATGLSSGTQYWFVVTSVNVSGESAWSNEADATTS